MRLIHSTEYVCTVCTVQYSTVSTVHEPSHHHLLYLLGPVSVISKYHDPRPRTSFTRVLKVSREERAVGMFYSLAPLRSIHAFIDGLILCRDNWQRPSSFFFLLYCSFPSPSPSHIGLIKV